jgi:hypothetical protein
MRTLSYLFIATTTVFFTACESPKSESNEAATEVAPAEVPGVMTKNGLTLTKLTGSPEYPGASIKTAEPTNDATVKAGKVNFKYDVANYELGAQTSDAEGKGLANSGMGQHIHAILNNQPYMAHYGPGFETDLTDGHYVLLSFLSRSYHESVKAPGAFDVIQFNVGKSDAAPADLSTPHMFYSRPKGTYTGPVETDNLLLDFFLVNCTLSPDGYKVRATINGTDFMLDEWVPYTVKGLPIGEVTVKLELLDAQGQLVASPFNPVERTVTLAPAAPAAE